MITSPNNRSRRAFTLIELLVVIAIIAIVAGLIVGLAAVVGDKKKISRAQVERDRLVTLIESYKAKLGVYPPDNPNDPGRNTLLYELAGCIRKTGANPNYMSPFDNIRASELGSALNSKGIVNAVDIGGETSQVHRLLKNLKPDQTAVAAAPALSLVVPIDDANRQRPNPWRYLVGENARHNKDSFDLWVEIYAKGKTAPGICSNCIVIGNWKD